MIIAHTYGDTLAICLDIPPRSNIPIHASRCREFTTTLTSVCCGKIGESSKTSSEGPKSRTSTGYSSMFPGRSARSA